MRQWTRTVAQRAMALGVGLAVVGSSGLALADGHGHGDRGRGNPAPVTMNMNNYNYNNLGSAAWAGAALRLLVTQGVIQGVGNGQLNPTGTTTRAQMATMLGRLLGWSATAGSPGAPAFQDGPSIPAWALGYVQQAASKGYMQGEGEDFAPSQQVTWAQAAVIIARVFSFPPVPPDQVAADLAQLPYSAGTPAWAAPAVAADFAAGLFQGLLGQIFMPNQPISRAELAALLQQAEQLKPAVVAQANSIVVGTVNGVQPGVVTVATSQGTVTVPLESGVVIYAGGAPSSLNALQQGVSVVIAVDSNGSAAFIEITSAGTPSSGTTVSGSVASISPTEITLSSGTTSTTYAFAANLTVSGATSLAGVLQGDQVTLTVNAANLVSAIDVTSSAAQATVGGTVSAVTASSITLAATTAGGPFVYAFASGGPSVVGQVSSLAAVGNGDQVSLTLNSLGQVVQIDVTSAVSGVASGTVSGVVATANPANGQVTVLVYANNAPSLDTAVLAPGATVTLAGNAASLAALQAGDPVSLSVNASGQALSVTASALPAAEQYIAGSVVANSGGSVTIANGSGQVTLSDGASPVAVSAGQIVPLSSIAVDADVAAVGGAANGSLLVVLNSN